MRTWARAVVDLRCGLCGSTVEQGAPYQRVELEGVKKAKIRCEDCAEGSAPPDLPATLNTSQQLTKRMQRLKDAIAATDWKSRAVGK